MGPFKVGDKVRRIDRRNSYGTKGKAVEIGEVCTVSKIIGSEDQWLALTEHPDLGTGSLGLYFEPVRYSRYFTEPNKAEPTTGHVADSPIQKHSMGDFYPLAVVGYGQGDTVLYVVENLKDQTVCGTQGKAVRQWSSADLAQKFLERRANRDKDNSRDPVVWHKARPVFENNRLALPQAPAQRKRVVFEKQEGIIEINGAYYKALEQDIG